jgi:5'(3')-deoxyribonucleotidase
MNNIQHQRRIAVDIDGVLADYHSPFVRFYNARNRTNFNVDDLLGYDFWRAFKTSEEESERAIRDFFFSEGFEGINPIKDSQNSTWLLSQKNTLAIITARPDYVKERTLKWTDRYFPRIFSDVHFTSQFGGNGSRKKKYDFCLDYNYELIIEDVAEYANDCAEKGVKSFLMNRPWNRNFSLHPLVQRVNDWSEILQILK